MSLSIKYLMSYCFILPYRYNHAIGRLFLTLLKLEASAFDLAEEVKRFSQIKRTSLSSKT